MPDVRIYQPAKTTMQSGRGKTKRWILEYALESKRQPEPLMGWVASGDTLNQVKLGFDTVDEAIAFAAHKKWTYEVITPQTRVLQGRTYMDNFKYVAPVKNTETK